MPRYSRYGYLDNALVEEGDTGFFRLNSRLRPDQLKQGELASSINGRMGIDGAWQPRRGVDQFGPVISSNSEALTLPFYLYADVSSSGISRALDKITMTLSTVDVATLNTGTLAYISGITGITPDPNGNRVITKESSTEISITVTGLSGTVAGTATIGAPILDDDAINVVYGSCLFSDPSTENTEYIILATYNKAVWVKISDGSTGNIVYPSGVTLSANCDMLQVFNFVGIFRDGLTAMEWNGSFVGTPAFTLVANGAFTQPVVYTAAGNTACTQGVVTVTDTHALSVGDTVQIFDKGSSPLTNGDRYQVATISTTVSFTFFANVDDFTATAVVLGSRQSVGLGFTHMPCPPWAIYHQRRLWMPFQYISSGTSGSPTITDRNIRDEIIASDILDADTYDQIENQFRIASGGADYVVALQPFAEDNLLVLMRNSIHLITGISGDLEDTVVKEITREVGCIARKSVVQVGNQVFFLSDNGVYSVDFGDLYNLRGSSLPISEAIDPLIQRINPDYAENSVATYNDNRYYISIPLDASTTNNAILVFNFLNQGWESLDTIDQDGWNINNIIRAGSGGPNKLYAINSFGGIHILNERVDDVDNIVLTPGGTTASYYIESELTTRQYTQGVMDRKRFNSYELQAESSTTNASDANLTLETENPDSIKILDSISTVIGEVLPVAEDVSIRARLGNVRGYGAQLTITPTQGRPKIRTLKLISQLTDLAISSKQ
jgi:hypothetical protein